jgi:hypothetical protein
MRTLILSCSATKRPDAGLLRAVDRYDGPAYRTLRANLPPDDDLRVFILSAELGLIGRGTLIRDYDRRMTRARAAELRAPVREKLKAIDRAGMVVSWSNVLFVGGELYRELLRSAAAEARFPAAINYASGGIGEQLGQLKAFLLEGLRS